jgi:hypothetical protein
MFRQRDDPEYQFPETTSQSLSNPLLELGRAVTNLVFTLLALREQEVSESEFGQT